MSSELEQSIIEATEPVGASKMYDVYSSKVKEDLLWRTVGNYYQQSMPLTYSPTQNTRIEMVLPQDITFHPKESYFTFDWNLTNSTAPFTSIGNTIAGNVYTRFGRLESSWSPFQYIQVQVGSDVSFIIDNPVVFLFIKYHYVGQDYIQSTLKETGLFRTPAEGNYYTGGLLSNVDAIGNAGTLGVELTGADIAAGDFAGTTAANIATALNALNVRYTLGQKGVNQSLGLNLEPNDGGIAVGQGNQYIMWIPELFQTEKLMFLGEMPQIKLTFVLQQGSQCISQAPIGQGVPAVVNTMSYMLRNFTYNMRTMNVSDNALQRVRSRQANADLDIRSGLRYDFEHIYHQGLQWNSNVLNQRYLFDVGLKKCKSLFMVFRDVNDFNNFGTTNTIEYPNGNFIYPAGAGELQVQLFLDNVTPYPQLPIVVRPKGAANADVQVEIVNAQTLTLEALSALDDIWLGQKESAASYTQDGNFIVGIKLKSSELVSGIDLKQLAIRLVRSAQRAGTPTLAVDVFIVQDQTLICSKRFATLL